MAPPAAPAAAEYALVAGLIAVVLLCVLGLVWHVIRAVGRSDPDDE